VDFNQPLQELKRMKCGSSARQVSITGFQPEDTGSNPSLPHHYFKFVESTASQRMKKLYRVLIDDYHKYKEWSDYVGRRIGWVIFEGSEAVGSIGIASSPMNLKARDEFIGWTKEQKMKRLNCIAINYRFSMRKKGLGSQVISQFIPVAKKAWKEHYGDQLILLETMVQPPFKGTCYLASGWNKVGMTKGTSLKRPPSKALIKRELSGEWGKAHSDRAKLIMESGWKTALKTIPYWEFSNTKVEPKIILVKPLHRYWKKALLTTKEVV
jgi:hypothetical protein